MSMPRGSMPVASVSHCCHMCFAHHTVRHEALGFWAGHAHTCLHRLHIPGVLQVKTITALTVAALAEAAAPYGIESFDDVLEPLWKGIRLLRGKVLAAFLKVRKQPGRSVLLLCALSAPLTEACHLVRCRTIRYAPSQVLPGSLI